MEMEVVLGIDEEARPKASSTEIGSAKQNETLGDDSTQENGVRVSDNGEQKLLAVSDRVSDDTDDNKAKENVVEKENLNDSGVIEDCVKNGVSSLLKLKQDFSDKDNLEEEKESVQEEDGEAEEEKEEHGYYVGDFVWGKIKNHPWWPGQIYDPSDASDLALKIKQKGKLLVAYFGDGTFAWCGPSQLKPFAESFKECSKISNSKGFLGAVEEAVEEMGRHIERLLICDFAEDKHKFDSSEAKNAGIKEGVLVRVVRRELISPLLVEKPQGILEDVKGFAETVCFSDLLELEILKSKVSAFYWSTRGYGLTEYHEPQSVPGLEDMNNDDDDDDEDENTDEDENNENTEEEKEEEEEEEALDPKESFQRSLEKCSGFPDHRLQHRRKQKSIAEILENESAAKVRFETEPAEGSVKSSRKKVKHCGEGKGELENVATTTPRRRRMSKISTIEDSGHKNVEENGKGKTLSRKRKKRDLDDDDDGGEDREESAHVEEIEKNGVSDLETDIDSTPLASLRKRVRVVDASSVERSAGNGDTTTQTSKRERKKSKYLSPDYLSDFSWKGRKTIKKESKSSKVSSHSQVGEQMIDASSSLMAAEEEKLINPCEPLSNGLGHQELSEELSNAVDFLRLGATPKEMRDLISVAALGTQYPEDSSSRDMVREFMSIYRSFTYHDGANSKFIGSYNSSDIEREELNETGKPETKGKERKDKKRKAKQQTEEIEQIGKEENETDKHVTTKERKRKKPKSKKQGDEEEEETQKETSESTKKERKRKKPKSMNQAAEEEEEPRQKLGETRKKRRKSKKPKYEEDETRKESREIEKPEEKQREEESEKKFSGAELYITFGPGSSLPKKEDLIEIYEKFGALDEERTYVFYNNFCARVAFVNIADGEKAFESSQETCPFASTAKVTYRLKYPNERTEEKTAEVEGEVAETTIEMEYVKKKLEEMRSFVDESEGGMSEEVKAKLEDEMVNLLEKVRKMRSS